MKRNIVINLFGGPGTGKSRTMGGVFSKLKFAGIDAEQVPEYAKDLVWKESFKTLENQVYVFGKQYYRLESVRPQVDVVVTDSPILLSLIYNNGINALPALVLECHYAMKTLNIFLGRVNDYNPNGRMQNEEEAIEFDKLIHRMLHDNDIEHIHLDADEDALGVIVELVKEM